MPTFAGGGRVVEAVRFTGDNLDEVCAWINVEDEDVIPKAYYGRSAHAPLANGYDAVLVFEDGSKTYLTRGDWLIYRGGKFVAVSKRQFDNTYHEVYETLDEPTDEVISPQYDHYLDEPGILDGIAELKVGRPVWIDAAVGGCGGAMVGVLVAAAILAFP